METTYKQLRGCITNDPNVIETLLSLREERQALCRRPYPSVAAKAEALREFENRPVTVDLRKL